MTNTQYSRREVVSALSSYYEFLQSLHLPEGTVKYPPKDGWPEITRDTLRNDMETKNDTVIDLLRHMPYLEYQMNDPYHIFEMSGCIDYTNQSHGFEPIVELTTLPPHVATLSHATGGENGHWIFIDTQAGTIILCDFQVSPSGMIREGTTEPSPYVDIFDSDCWRGYPTYRPANFFKMAKNKLRKLELVPINTHKIMAGSPYGDPVVDIYRKHGWPNGDYDKEACMKAVAAFDA